MAYNNDWYEDDYDRPRRRSRSGRGYGSNRRSFRGRGGNRSQSPKKRTSCTAGQDKNDNFYCYGHRFLKRSVMIASAFKAPGGKGKNGKARINEGYCGDKPKNGYQPGELMWVRYLVNVATGDTFALARAQEPRVVTGFYYPSKGHIVIPELGVMMKPKSNYFGTYQNK